MPQIRKAKSQSFRTRRPSSEKRSPNPFLGPGNQLLPLNSSFHSADNKLSPLTPKSPLQPKSSDAIVATTTTSASTGAVLSRQGTLRASNRRKNSLNLTQDRRSPIGFNDRSPQGKRSPMLKSPNELPLNSTFGTQTPNLRSPTLSINLQERRSPIGAAAPFELGSTRRSPVSTVHVQDSRDIDVSPTGYNKRQSVIYFTPISVSGEKRSPVAIPPITVSNPTESGKMAEMMREDHSDNFIPLGLVNTIEKEPEKKERGSVIKDILAFMRKPSKNLTSRTHRFAHAFTRADSGSSSGPLIRQSTFSASPAASSSAAKSAVTKQMSESGFEPKMSLKFAHYAKLSLKLRRSANDDKAAKQNNNNTHNNNNTNSSTSTSKRASCDSTSGILDIGNSRKVSNSSSAGGVGSGRASPANDTLFELAHVHFEKVGDSYIKHDKIRVQDRQTVEHAGHDGDMANFVEEINNSIKLATLPTDFHFQRRSESREPIEPRISEERESDEGFIITEEFRTELASILKNYQKYPTYVNIEELTKEIEDCKESQTKDELELGKLPLQCPTIEFEPPSRRSSFNPSPSPFLRNSAEHTDTDLINLTRLDSGGDSFELIDHERKSSRAESSFDCPYSSRDTSFDISRYQSTSYDDATSSFEIVDADEKKKAADMQKSSIELMDAETFDRASSASGRKSSLETHFDYAPTESAPPSLTPSRSPNLLLTKRQKGEHFRSLHVASAFSAFSRARSPLSNQTSSNYSSHESNDSSSSLPHATNLELPKKHFPLTIRQNEEEVKTFLCTDQQCASIFEPRPSSVLTQQLSTGSMSTPSGYANGACAGAVGTSAGFSSGSEFEPPSPRRATSASPKHTFTFRIVLKKVDSSPEPFSIERQRRTILDRCRRRDSMRKRKT